MRYSQYIIVIFSILFGYSEYAWAAEEEKASLMRDMTIRAYEMLPVRDYDGSLKLNKEVASMVSEDATRDEWFHYTVALNNIAYIYLFADNNPTLAYPYLLRAKRIASEQHFNNVLGAIYDNIAKIQDDFGDTMSALETYKSAIKCTKDEQTEISAGIYLMIFNDLVSFAVNHNLLEDIRDELNAFTNNKIEDRPMRQYSDKICKGILNILRGNVEEGLLAIETATSLIDSKVDKERYLINHYLLLSSLYLRYERAKDAHSLTEKALDLANESEITDKLPQIYRVLGDTYTALNDSNNAQMQYLRAYELDDSLHNVGTYTRISLLEPQLDIDVLNTEIKYAEARHRNRMTVIWILAVGVGIIMFLVVMLIIRNRRLSASHRCIAEGHRQLMSASEQMNALLREYENTIETLRVATYPPQREDEGANDVGNKLKVPFDNEQKLKIINAVNFVMNETDEVYSPDFSIERLSKLTNTKTRYLSQLINESCGKSFTGMVAEVRVRKACKMLLSDAFQHTLTVESIAQEVGYKSRTHF